MASDLNNIHARLAEFFTHNEARAWLTARHPLLDGERPIDLIRDGKTDRVIAEIESIAGSTYS